jgi:hypothetical protein
LPSVNDCQVETDVAAPQLCLLQAHNVCKHHRNKGILLLEGGSNAAAIAPCAAPKASPAPRLFRNCSSVTWSRTNTALSPLTLNDSTRMRCMPIPSRQERQQRRCLLLITQRWLTEHCDQITCLVVGSSVCRSLHTGRDKCGGGEVVRRRRQNGGW